MNSSKSKVKFEVSNLAFNTVEGTFTDMIGTVKFSEEDFSNSYFNVCIAAKSVNTENDTRDEHLRTEDFFHVEKYPNICFKSSSIKKTANGYTAIGKLTMHGITKEVNIPFTFISNTFSGSLTLDRTDYNVGSDRSFMIGKEAKLEIICVIN
ncbi:YceI family protein [Flammeovirgaceae bacterium SG7u.111]|nr:YceI family protein [Flammeovirgaceae bacterium SG7u.132]WPO38768.1 YceI family protein [Flammeovirgaceae bacterium SG7u.111]